MKIPGLLITAAVLCSGAVAAAQQPTTTLEVDYGWGERVRSGRWAPITVRAWDSRTRGAILELYAPQGGAYAMQVRQFFTLSPTQSVFPLYAPLVQGGSDEPTIVIRDAASGKTLARFPPDPDRFDMYQRFADTGGCFVGISGLPTGWKLLSSDQSVVRADGGYLDPAFLPATPIGYDSLDLLILHRPNLHRLDGAQQRAIIDWVRGGGNLLLWPGDDPLPTAGPIVENLPCAIGKPIEVKFSKERRADLFLPGRSTAISGYELTPKDGAEAVDVLGTPEGKAYRRRLGLGLIAVAPVDMSQLRSNNTTASQAIWRPLLAGMSVLVEEVQPGNGSGSYYNVDADLGREGGAVSRIQNELADVPGAGGFGFSYVAISLLAMMVIVGPVDWFILKKLGRQPWTWVTTSGWIALVTLGALYMGHVFKSGDLYYRSVRLIDQAGDATIGQSSVVCLYSPRTTDYHLDAPRPAGDPAPANLPSDPAAGWWEPSTGENNYYGGYGMKTDIPFHQTQDGNAPEGLLINVWQLRFLRSQSTGSGSAMVRTDLSIQRRGNRRSLITGTIVNLTDRPLTNVRLRIGDRMCVLPDGQSKDADPLIARIEPHAEVRINAEPGEQDLLSNKNDGSSNRFNYGYRESRPADPATLWLSAADLDGPRSRRIDTLLKRGGFACVYAESADPAPPAVLREPGARERHYQLIRAVVPLRGDATPTVPQQ